MISANEALKLSKDACAREAMDLRVYVVGGGFQYLKMFFDAGFKGARSVDDADFLCFTGGEDVDPILYGEKPLPGTFFNPRRDQMEAFHYGQALADRKPMVGICRGGQFLNVMNEGKMWQDVNNHAIAGTHPIIDTRTKEVIHNMTSTHHQMMIPHKDGKVLALAGLSTIKKNDQQILERDKPQEDDVEVVWYQDSLSLCFQPHPEYHHGECRNYFLDLVDEYILPAT